MANGVKLNRFLIAALIELSLIILFSYTTERSANARFFFLNLHQLIKIIHLACVTQYFYFKGDLSNLQFSFFSYGIKKRWGWELLIRQYNSIQPIDKGSNEQLLIFISKPHLQLLSRKTNLQRWYTISIILCHINGSIIHLFCLIV